jgi:hypothetical protein
MASNGPIPFILNCAIPRAMTKRRLTTTAKAAKLIGVTPDFLLRYAHEINCSVGTGKYLRWDIEALDRWCADELETIVMTLCSELPSENLRGDMLERYMKLSAMVICP